MHRMVTFQSMCEAHIATTLKSSNKFRALLYTLISIMIVLFLAQKKNYIDTERWEQRPKRWALAPECELEFFFIEKKKDSHYGNQSILPISLIIDAR
jgi:hypothetical protein